MAASLVEGRHVLVVKLRCELGIRERRETARPEIDRGWTRLQDSTWNWDFAYDLHLQTDDATPADLADQVAFWLRTDPVPTVFERLGRQSTSTFRWRSGSAISGWKPRVTTSRSGTRSVIRSPMSMAP